MIQELVTIQGPRRVDDGGGSRHGLLECLLKLQCKGGYWAAAVASRASGQIRRSQPADAQPVIQEMSVDALCRAD